MDNSKANLRPSRDEIAAALAAITETYSRPDHAGVAVVDGWGCSLKVYKRHLELSDGIGEARRTRRYARATHGLSRVVVAGQSGMVTFDALRWLDRLKVGLVVLDGDDGRPMFASAPDERDDARLRRAQALAVGNEAGVAVARLLMGGKLAGQAAVLHRLNDEAAGATVAELAEAMGAASDIDEVRELEAVAADCYWTAWAALPVTARFASRDLRRVPAHWATFDGRRSVLASVNANRRAERPVNALLNYLYRLVEVEAAFALQAVGLDPGTGTVHMDQRGRQSMALDLMEPVRPKVDAWVLDLLERRSFRRTDFHEAPDGHCRLLAPLSHELAETLPRWRQEVAPWAEKVAHLLAGQVPTKIVLGHPLSGARRREAQAEVKARKARGRTPAAKQRPVGKKTSDGWSCPGCGAPVTNPRHVRCAACQAEDPRQAPALRKTRALAISRARQRDAKVHRTAAQMVMWPPVRESLAEARLSAIMGACGVAKSTAWSWKTGRTKPAPVHWPALAELGRQAR